ncbi:MAG: hypothetical protein LUG85_09385, partial [Clostridiales bacterium]|nr:hypothetical protein [Clostridiales bacterium]
RRIIEIAQTIIEASTERIVTNYPFENQELDNAVFSSLNRSYPKTGEFIHIVEFDQSNKSLKNIDNIFKSVRYCRIGFAPVYCYSVGLGEFNSSLFPYFFLTESYGLLFNENGSDGIFTNNEDFVKQLTIAANKLSSSCEPLGAFCDNVFKIKDHFQRLSGSKTIGCFCNHMCTLPISPPEVFEAGTSDNLPNREIFVQLVTNHYMGMRKFYDDEWHVMPEDSIDDYVKNGPQYDVPKSLMNTLPNEMRRLVLQSFYDIAKDNPKAYFFADKSIINFSDPCFNIEIYGSAVCIYGSIPTSEDPFSGQYRIFVKNKNIAQDFVYCKGFLERSGLYHSGEWMLSKISEAIESCKN